MLTARDILVGVLLPAMVSGIVLLLAWQPWRKRATSHGYWAPPLAIGLGFVAGYVGLFGLPKFPPVDSTNWIFYFAPALVAIALLDALIRMPIWLRAIIALAACVVATYLLLRPLLAGGEWTPNAARVLIAGIALAVFVAWLSLDHLSQRVPGTSLPLILTMVVGVSSDVIGRSGSVSLAQTGGMLAATCGAMFVLAAWAGNVSIARGTALVFTILWTCLLMSGRFFAELTWTNAGLLYVAPFFAWVGEIGPLRHRPRTRFVVRLAAVLVPLAIVGTVAYLSFNKAMSENLEMF